MSLFCKCLKLQFLTKFCFEYQYPYKKFFKMNSNYVIFEIIALSEVQFLNLLQLFKMENSIKYIEMKQPSSIDDIVL